MVAGLSLTPAEAVQVQAQLSSPRTAVGQPVQLSILVDGARGAEVPRNFAVDGLQISFRGQSTSVNMVNFQVSMIATYNFMVVPQREGTFTIPPLTVTVDGQPYQTSELTLEVVGAANLGLPPVAPPVRVQPAQPVQPPPGLGGQLPSTGPFRPNPPPQATPAPKPTPSNSVPIDKVAFAELILPDGDVYVGQFVPVEIRLYFDQRFRFELHSMPTFTGEGFTAERLSDPVERSQMIDGVPYQVVTFYSAITAVKTGTLQIPGLQLSVNVVVPSQQPRSNSLFDDFFGGDPFAGMFNETRELNLNTKPTELTVRSLPSEGKPPGFAGAIGQFEIEQSTAPARGKVGEPLKLTLTIKGQGNFARILAPPLLGDEAWRTYPGSDQFTPNDAVGFGGTKTFSLTIMPMQETEKSPFAEFSYFDPTTGRYVTLRTESDPVAITGGQIARSTPSPAPAVAAPSPDAAKPTTASAEPPEAQDLAHTPLAPATTWRPGSFISLVQRPEFLAAQAAAALGFFCLLAYLLLGIYQASAGGQQARSRKRLHHLWQSVEASRKDPPRFFEAARELLAESARLPGEEPIPGSEYRWLEHANLSPELRTGLTQILHSADQLRYAGSRSPSTSLSTEAAQEILQSWHQWLAQASKSAGGRR
jgi:hypothetical protein